MNFSRTKPFLLATAGSTVDGRVIDDKMLEEMASSYNPKTYGARLNIEHIRGISGDKPFRAYGDIIELSTGEVEVDFNGKKEKRKALYGTFDVTEDAKALNTAQQKVYPSIEIEPNFGGKGYAYLMSCALTDSPAAIATERLQFAVTRPGALVYSRDQAGTLEFADETGATTAEGGNFLNALTGVLDKFADKFGAKKEEAKPDPKPDAAPGTIDAAALTGLFSDLGTALQGAMTEQTNAIRGELDQFGLKLKEVEDKFEATPAPGQKPRPAADGGKFARTDC